MDERKYKNSDPWDDAVYGTGNTQPPKSHGGMIAALLIVVIFLSGIASALGLMNIKLFQQLNQLTAEEEENLPISFSVSDDISDGVGQEVYSSPTEATDRSGSELTLNLQPSPASAENISQEGGLSWQEIYEKNIASVVSITVKTDRDTITGTGVIFSHSGHIVTNSHVLEDAQDITILLSDNRTCTAQILGDDPVSDLAVLDINLDGLNPAEFGDSDALRVGDAVAAIGDPLGLELRGTFTDGIISAINRDVSVNGRTMTLLQTNAALNTGNSGGPLVNCYGQVIGINTMKLSTFTDNAVEGLGFAIPSTAVKDVVDQLVCQGYVSGRPCLGITGEPVAKFDQYYSGIPAGIRITEVEESHSEILVGDILTSLNGTAVTDLNTLENLIYALNVGDQVLVRLYRNGSELEVILTLTESKG